MSQKRYHIEFSGKIIPGWDPDEVKANLAKLLKANEEQLYQLFSGRRIIIKKNVDHLTAVKINNLFKDAGADCIITPVPGSNATGPPPLPPRSGPGQTDHTPTAAARAVLRPTEIRPGRFWYVVAILLFLIPTIGGGKSIFTAFTSYFSKGTRLTVPGETTIQAEKPGTYYIFYETSVFTESNIAQNLMRRDFDIMIMDLATGAELKLSPPEFDGTETYGATVRRAIAEVEFNTSGNYLATVAGELSGRDGLLIRPVDFTGMLKSFISAVVLFLLGVIAGPVAALVVFIKRQNHKRKLINAPLSEEEER